MVYIIFGLAAIITVLAAIELSNNADILSGKTPLGGLLVGTLLLGGATSLPEVTTSLTSVLISNPDIAVGNMLGSNMFNIFIIACFDIFYRNMRLYQRASNGHLYTAGLGLLLSIITLAALIRKLDFMILGVGVDTLLIACVYGIGMFVISGLSKDSIDNQLSGNDFQRDVIHENLHSTSIRRAVLNFSIAALAILGAGTLLSITGDTLAEITGLGSTFVGSFLMAATTSLPEAVAVLIALRLRNINLAIGSILGSNIFNMLILVGSDIVYQNGSILANVSPLHEITAFTVSMLSVLIIISLLRKKNTTSLSYLIPSLLIIVGYFVVTYLIFNS
ncbi:sodium:calcium antiporter [Paenisporosarcina macmurdoensis]|uniref:Sodium:calcium antiporter n=1 Tax=Paenisporosarcina macmurdoensis TaxID=212659 RepID=A0ABW1L6Z8_9BACL